MNKTWRVRDTAPRGGTKPKGSRCIDIVVRTASAAMSLPFYGAVLLGCAFVVGVCMFGGASSGCWLAALASCM